MIRSMWYLGGRPRRAVSSGAIALSMASVFAPSALAASPACPSVDTTQAFSRWGDHGQYTAVPGGSFDADTGWSASGTAAIVDADNPFGLAAGAGALRLGAGASMTSPPICIDRSYPHLRFVLRASEARAKLTLTVLFADAKGKVIDAQLAAYDAKPYRAWNVSRIVKLGAAVPRAADVRDIRLRFSVGGRSGAWLVDDVYLDPYKRS